MNEEKNMNELKKTDVISFSLAILLWVAVYGYQLFRLCDFWSRHDDYSYGFLIFPISLYLVWRRRKQLALIPWTPKIWGWLIILLSLIIYVIGVYAETVTMASLSMLSCLVGLILYFCGPAVLRALWFPIIFLLFMIPIPTPVYVSLTVPLQLYVTNVSVALVGVLGIPLNQEGNIIHLPETTLAVIDACSGLRSLLALMALSAMLSDLTLKRFALRIAQFLLALPVAIIVNIFRVVLTTLLAYKGSMAAIQGGGHVVIGISTFIFALAIVWIVNIFFRKFDRVAS
jgi:exosortase